MMRKMRSIDSFLFKDERTTITSEEGPNNSKKIKLRSYTTICIQLICNLILFSQGILIIRIGIIKIFIQEIFITLIKRMNGLLAGQTDKGKVCNAKCYNCRNDHRSNPCLNICISLGCFTITTSEIEYCTSCHPNDYSNNPHQ